MIQHKLGVDMSGPFTFCEKLARFLMTYSYGNDFIIHEDRDGIMGKGVPVGLCISNRTVNSSDFERARQKHLKVVAENTSFGIRVFLVPNHAVSEQDISRLLHCSGPALYSRMWG